MSETPTHVETVADQVSVIADVEEFPVYHDEEPKIVGYDLYLTGNHHLTIDGETPLCGNPHVTDKVASDHSRLRVLDIEEYHEEFSDVYATQISRCKSCTRSYLKRFDSPDPLFRAVLGPDKGDYVRITTTDGHEFVGMVSHDVSDSHKDLRSITVSRETEYWDNDNRVLSKDNVRIMAREGNHPVQLKEGHEVTEEVGELASIEVIEEEDARSSIDEDGENGDTELVADGGTVEEATEYPIKVRWTNDSEALTKFLTREIEPLEGTYPEQRPNYSDEDLETVREAVCGRSKTYLVIEDNDERELVIGLLERHIEGIGHPDYGGTWANRNLSNAVKRRIEELKQYGEESEEADAEESGSGDAFRSKRMENAYYWAAQADGWMENGPNAGIEGTYYVEIIGGRPVIVLDDTWNAETTSAIVESLREYGFPRSIETNELSDGSGRRTVFLTEPTDDRLTADYYPGDWREYEVRGGFRPIEEA